MALSPVIIPSQLGVGPIQMKMVLGQMELPDALTNTTEMKELLHYESGIGDMETHFPRVLDDADAIFKKYKSLIQSYVLTLSTEDILALRSHQKKNRTPQMYMYIAKLPERDDDFFFTPFEDFYFDRESDDWIKAKWKDDFRWVQTHPLFYLRKRLWADLVRRSVIVLLQSIPDSGSQYVKAGIIQQERLDKQIENMKSVVPEQCKQPKRCRETLTKHLESLKNGIMGAERELDNWLYNRVMTTWQLWPYEMTTEFKAKLTQMLENNTWRMYIAHPKHVNEIEQPIPEGYEDFVTENDLILTENDIQTCRQRVFFNQIEWNLQRLDNHYKDSNKKWYQIAFNDLTNGFYDYNEIVFARAHYLASTSDSTEWLNSNQLNKPLKLLTSGREWIPGSSWAAVDTGAFDKTDAFGNKIDNETRKRLIGRKKLDKFSNLIIPLHIRLEGSTTACHWAVMFIDRKKMTMTYYDSWKDNIEKFNLDRQNSLPSEYFAMAREFIPAIDGKIHSKADEWTMIVEKGPYQQDGSSCGVFVYMRARQMVKAIPFDNQFNTIQKARHEIDELSKSHG